MKKRYIILISFLLIVFSFWLGMIVEEELASWDDFGKPDITEKRLYFPNSKNHLFIRSYNWGLTYDHKITAISTNYDGKIMADSISEYIFKGFDGIIYKQQNDILKIYSRQKGTIPVKFESNIIVELIEINNISEWNKMKSEIENDYQYFD